MTSTNSVVQNAMAARLVARNAIGIEEAEQKAGQFVSAAKSRIGMEAKTIQDSLNLLRQVRGYMESPKISTAVKSLKKALDCVADAFDAL